MWLKRLDLYNKSRMSREVQVRFCERLEGKFLRPTRLCEPLNKLEELNIIGSADEWILLRETRNIVTHEYPFITDEVIQGLNLLSNHYLLIMEIWKRIETYINKRF